VVDDEPDLVANLVFNLEREGVRTKSATTGAQALAIAHAGTVPDLVILDLMLPDISGTEVCRRLRQDDRTRLVPILMLTAKGEEIDRVVGLEVGADDYVVKPFSVRELMLRVRSLLRRASPSLEVDASGSVTCGALRIDEHAHRVFVNDKEVALTALEFKLLGTLISRRGRVQTRERLLEDVWDMRADLTTRTVDTHVKRLRQKLGVGGDLIETLRGVGYRISDPAEGTVA
jgi:two-component system phosphate regulon response regulator PhoB